MKRRIGLQRHHAIHRTRWSMHVVGALTGMVLFLTACSNSVLRNAAEAGYETLTDSPAPTPTPPR